MKKRMGAMKSKPQERVYRLQGGSDATARCWRSLTWAKCPPSSPGSRDKRNPVYVAPAMNSPVTRPERTLKEKQLFKLTGEILAQILFLVLLMTAVHSSQNPSRFLLHRALRKSFSHGFSEISLLQHFYPWARHTLLPNHQEQLVGFALDSVAEMLNNVFPKECFFFSIFHQLPTLCHIITLYPVQ